MSARHWLERDPSQSPGLQRILETQQAAATAKAQAEQQAHEAAIAAQEARQQRTAQEILVGDLTDRILPTMEEIKDFANRTKAYPIGDKGRNYLVSPLKLINPAAVEVSRSFEPVVDIRLVYGFRGSRIGSKRICDDWVDRTYETVEGYGINARIVANNDRAEILVLTQKTEIETLPATPGGNFAKVYHPPKPERKVKRDINEWVKIENPFDDESIKHCLGEAFHNPVHLDEINSPMLQAASLQPESQTSMGIASLIKGLWGLK